MRERSVTVIAEDEAAALQQAAARLQDSPSNIKLEAVGLRTYRGVLRNADAEVSIEISADGLEASIASYIPPLGDGEGLSLQSLDRVLAQAGIGRSLFAGLPRNELSFEVGLAYVGWKG